MEHLVATPLPKELFRVLNIVCSIPNYCEEDFAKFLQEAFDGFTRRTRERLIFPKSSFPTPTQLARLAQFASAAQKFFQNLDDDTIIFLGITLDAMHGREHTSHRTTNEPLSPIVEKAIRAAHYKRLALEYLGPAAAAGKASKLLTMVKYQAQKRGAPPKKNFQDPEGPFYLFAYQLTQAIYGLGGRATIGDKSNGTGSLVAALSCIAPFFPKDACLPGFITDRDNDCQSGMARLAQVKHDAINEMDEIIPGQKIA